MKEESKVEGWVKGIGWGVMLVVWVVLFKVMRRILG